jgi:hypothetical protein
LVGLHKTQLVCSHVLARFFIMQLVYSHLYFRLHVGLADGTCIYTWKIEKFAVSTNNKLTLGILENSRISQTIWWIV